MGTQSEDCGAGYSQSSDVDGCHRCTVRDCPSGETLESCSNGYAPADTENYSGKNRCHKCVAAECPSGSYLDPGCDKSSGWINSKVLREGTSFFAKSGEEYCLTCVARPCEQGGTNVTCGSDETKVSTGYKSGDNTCYKCEKKDKWFVLELQDSGFYKLSIDGVNISKLSDGRYKIPLDASFTIKADSKYNQEDILKIVKSTEFSGKSWNGNQYADRSVLNSIGYNGLEDLDSFSIKGYKFQTGDKEYTTYGSNSGCKDSINVAYRNYNWEEDNEENGFFWYNCSKEFSGSSLIALLDKDFSGWNGEKIIYVSPDQSKVYNIRLGTDVYGVDVFNASPRGIYSDYDNKEDYDDFTYKEPVFPIFYWYEFLKVPADVNNDLQNYRFEIKETYLSGEYLACPINKIKNKTAEECRKWDDYIYRNSDFTNTSYEFTNKTQFNLADTIDNGLLLKTDDRRAAVPPIFRSVEFVLYKENKEVFKYNYSSPIPLYIFRYEYSQTSPMPTFYVGYGECQNWGLISDYDYLDGCNPAYIEKYDDAKDRYGRTNGIVKRECEYNENCYTDEKGVKICFDVKNYYFEEYENFVIESAYHNMITMFFVPKNPDTILHNSTTGCNDSDFEIYEGKWD